MFLTVVKVPWTVPDGKALWVPVSLFPWTVQKGGCGWRGPGRRAEGQDAEGDGGASGYQRALQKALGTFLGSRALSNPRPVAGVYRYC